MAATTPDLAEELRRARARDAEAWRAIYVRFSASVRRVCAGFGEFDAAEVDDLVQETFVRAFENLGSIRDPGAFPAWLLTVARSRCLKRLRRRATERRVSDSYAVDPALGVEAPRADADGGEDPQVRVVRELLDGLPPGPERETVHLFYVEGKLSAREIAERMGVGKSAITMRLERFRSRVKRRLAAILQREEGS